MYWPDIVMVAIILFFTVKSAVRGFMTEISSVIAIAAGFFIASSSYITLANKFPDFVTNQGLRYLLSFAVIFALVYVGLILLGLAGKKIMKVSMLGWFDRLAGGFLGLAKGVFVVSVVLILLTSFLPARTGFLKESRTYRYLDQPIRIILSLVPHYLRNAFDHKEKALQKVLQMGKPKPDTEPRLERK